MTNHNTEQLISYLLHYGISSTMISILEKQHINDEDLQAMDRDDVEHLFKNQYGFTFRDRKQFWHLLQKIQTTQTSDAKSDHIMDSPEVLEHIYQFAEVDFEENDSKQQEQQPTISSSSSLMTNKQTPIINLIDDNKLNEDNDNEDDDERKKSNASSYVSELSFSPDYVFTYPSILPSFSANITQALRTNTIHKQWAPFVNELARWVMSIKPCLREQHEYRAIGQTLYEKYPSIGTAGPKPWSFLCRSLSQRIRTERWQRRKTFGARKRKENEINKISEHTSRVKSKLVL